MMAAEVVAGVALALGLVWYVMIPVLRPAAVRPAAGGADDGADEVEDLSPRTVALRALKEIEFDRATGKLSDADYADLKQRYTAEALAALRDAPAAAAPSPSLAATPPRAVCPDHGSRPEDEAVFCSQCGRRLAAAGAYCARCGATLEAGATYCNSCGVRVAA